MGCYIFSTIPTTKFVTLLMNVSLSANHERKITEDGKCMHT
jgi:hypothetical protein